MSSVTNTPPLMQGSHSPAAPAEQTERTCWSRMIRTITCRRQSPEGVDSRHVPETTHNRPPIYKNVIPLSDSDINSDDDDGSPKIIKSPMGGANLTSQIDHQTDSNTSKNESQDEIASQPPDGDSANTAPMVTEL